MKKSFEPANFLKTLLVISGILAVLAFRETWLYLLSENYALWRSKRLFLLIAYVVNIAGVLSLVTWDPDALLQIAAAKVNVSKGWKVVGGVFLLLASIIPALIIIFDSTDYIQPAFPLVWIAWWLAIIAAVFLRIGFGTRIDALFALALLLIGFFARTESWLPMVSTYPFSLGWSEVSRYYNASLFFSEKIYGEAFSWSFLHPTRYLLQSLPFLFEQLPFWVHRAWQVFLWFFLSLSTGLAFGWRLGRHKKAFIIPLALWFFIFMLQGAVYYHLQVAVLIVLLGSQKNDFKRASIALFFASLWAGISRVNWIPVPAMLTILLFLLEEPFSRYKKLWDYLKKPILWTLIGISTAFASQSTYVFVSGNSDNIASFGSSFTSSLLWYRLLPNTTYPPGIILSTLFVSFPLFGILFSSLHGKRETLHWIRHLGTWSILIVLLVGGLVVSTKIGGGGDLHNMDAYLVILGVWAGYIFIGGVNIEELGTGQSALRANSLWVAFAIVIPFWLAMRSMSPIPEYDFAKAKENFTTIQDVVAEAAQNGEEVLFITQRHLLTFGMVERVALEPKYDVVELMEMAMSGNTLYLESFYDDLYSHRFAVIVAPPQFSVIKDEELDSFAEENNAWVTKVSEHILCTYEPSGLIKKSDIVLYLPKADMEDCQFSK